MVSKFPNITYTLSLVTDPLTGPYTTSVSLTVGYALVTIRLTQVTAGPVSSVSVWFGDGTAAQTFSFNVASSPINLTTHNYSTTGTFKIYAAATTGALTGVPIYINNITVNVAPRPTYQGK
jgi:hypothetical protein